MPNANTPINTNEDAQSGQQKGTAKQKKSVDVATLETSRATSGMNPKIPGPVAVGEASS